MGNLYREIWTDVALTERFIVTDVSRSRVRDVSIEVILQLGVVWRVLEGERSRTNIITLFTNVQRPNRGEEEASMS